ncbi:MAG: tetratricopeptide repeat protein [Acidobacteriia bacterium]|nr:tetratricopeptide repeat protein [Terriglobia bacterium]
MKDRLLIGILLAAVALVYGNTLRNQFTMDDTLYVMGNPQTTQPSLQLLFSENKITSVYRPLTFASIALSWALGGTEPLGYHLLNLLLHAAVVWLLYLLLREIFAGHPQGKNAAFAAALLFAVHPIHSEAVASVMGRAEMMAAGFLLAGWILHLRDREIPALLCFALAMLSKESAVAAFPLVLLGDYATGRWKSPRRYAAIAGVTALYLALLRNGQGGHFGQPTISLLDNPLASLPPFWRILNALRVAWKYVWLHFYPVVLSCDYSFNQIPMYRDFRHTLPAALAAAAVVAIWIWAIRKHRAGLALAGGIYLAGFAATANILMPTGTIMGERLAYLPSAGFCALAALAWIWLMERQRMLAWGLLTVVLLALAVRTVARNGDWRDNLALYSSAVRAVPNSAKMHSNLGGEYMIRNQFDLARDEFQTALRIYPDSPDTLASFGLLELRLGNYQSAGSLMEKALRMSARDNPHYDSMVVDFAVILSKTDHVEAALDFLNREIAEAPGFARAWSTRAGIRFQRNELGPARNDAEAALRIDPGDAQAQQVLQQVQSGSAARSH